MSKQISQNDRQRVQDTHDLREDTVQFLLMRQEREKDSVKKHAHGCGHDNADAE